MAISDAKLARLARKYDTLSEQKKDIEAEQEKIKSAVIRELDRRGTKAIEHDGVRVSIVRQSRTNYNLDLAREVLGARFKRVTKQVLDPALIAQQQQAGKISIEEVAEFATISYTAPYISVGSAGE